MLPPTGAPARVATCIRDDPGCSRCGATAEGRRGAAPESRAL